MHKDFLDIADYSGEELLKLLDLAVDLKKACQQGGNDPILKGKVLAMIFQKPSLRTRVSFDMGMRHLGGMLYTSHLQRSVWANANRLLMWPGCLKVMSMALWLGYLSMRTYWIWPNGQISL